jgi:hypothetical protein
MANSVEIDRAERIATLVKAARIARAHTIHSMLQRLFRRARRDGADVAWAAQVRPAIGNCR